MVAMVGSSHEGRYVARQLRRGDSRAGRKHVDGRTAEPGPAVDLGPVSPARVGLLRASMLTARPRQWSKNLLVFGAPVTGGVLLEPTSFVRALSAFAAFCLVASGIYFVNDLVDRDMDRAHPVKRRRPVAAGHLTAGLAVVLAALLLVGGLLLAALGAGPRLVGVVGLYIALSLAYTFVLRSMVLLDIAAVAGGFVLRAVAGGVAVDVPLSSWFLIVACFGALFIAAGKRRAEHASLGAGRGEHRRTLDEYSEQFLRYIVGSSSTVTIAAYCLWAFEGEAGRSLQSGLSIVPFVLGIYRYVMLLEGEGGGTPEELVLRDRSLLVFGCLWVVLVGWSAYLH
jgi:decaprenyl-phosphate phosphoribosyltransferase